MGTKFGNQSSYGKKQEEKLAKEVIEKQGKYSKKDEDKLQAEIEESSNDNK